MDYRSQIKEKIGKLLFLEMNIKGFKESIGIPEYVEFKNKDLYLPISTEYISSNIGNEIIKYKKIKSWNQGGNLFSFNFYLYAGNKKWNVVRI